MQLFAVLLSTVALAVSTIATPLLVAERSELDIDPPTIIVPQAGETWMTGLQALLCWQTDPQLDFSATGNAYLGSWVGNFGYFDNKSDLVLASNFPLYLGCTDDVNVPADLTPNDYAIFLTVNGANTGSSSLGPIVISNGTTSG